jgi:hypothetical protein
MPDFSNISEQAWFLPSAAIALLMVVWLAIRYFRSQGGNLDTAIAAISFDSIQALVIPSADEGEILVDYLLLTSKGLLILDVKDAQGIIFAGDKLQEWTVINDDRRYMFSNPQPALYDRIAAVRQIVREVPVAGRILFLDGADFTKGVPDLVSNLTDLVSEFGEPDKNAAKFKIEAFKPHWDLIRKEALSSNSP